MQSQDFDRDLRWFRPFRLAVPSAMPRCHHRRTALTAPRRARATWLLKVRKSWCYLCTLTGTVGLKAGSFRVQGILLHVKLFYSMPHSILFSHTLFYGVRFQ